MPLVWTSRLQGTPLPERVAGSNLIASLSAAAAKFGKSVFLVGGMPGDAEAAAAALRARHPELHVAGVRGDAPEGSDDLVEDLRRLRPDIVYVSLGKIAEERLIERLRESNSDAWFIGVGTSFGSLAGRVRRAPRLMRNVGLEWVHRWTQEPARLTGRYLRCIPLAIRLLGGAAIKRARRTAGLQ
jgi:N-acetylglucosaminyldiphosphoundecaprenol N-acetyl-beta-D-mannosaminyltransferase